MQWVLVINRVAAGGRPKSPQALAYQRQLDFLRGFRAAYTKVASRCRLKIHVVNDHMLQRADLTRAFAKQGIRTADLPALAIGAGRTIHGRDAIITFLTDPQGTLEVKHRGRAAEEVHDQFGEIMSWDAYHADKGEDMPEEEISREDIQRRVREQMEQRGGAESADRVRGGALAALETEPDGEAAEAGHPTRENVPDEVNDILTSLNGLGTDPDNDLLARLYENQGRE